MALTSSYVRMATAVVVVLHSTTKGATSAPSSSLAVGEVTYEVQR